MRPAQEFVSRNREIWPRVSHYYGDFVRILFVTIAILAGVSVPFSGNATFAALVASPAILTLVVLAGLTNPHLKAVLLFDAVAAGAVAIVAEIFAVLAFSAENLYAFALFEGISVLSIGALYFSVKSYRAALMNKIGRIDGVGEFDDSSFLDVHDNKTPSTSMSDVKN